MDAFVEEVLDVGYDYGAVGGPEFSTSVVVTGAGREARNANWEQERGRWDLGARNVNEARKNMLLSFFRARRGRAVGFRFRDWLDFRVVHEPLPVTGEPTAQLVRVADEGYRYDVVKPRSGVTFRRDGSALTVDGVDTETGIVTFLPLSTAAISAITQANPGVITTTADHGFTTGDLIWLSGIGGMTDLNDRLVEITVTETDEFSIGIDTSEMPAYTSGGTAARYPQPGDTLDWSGEYDKPVRFDTDRFLAEFLGYSEERSVGIYALESLPVQEVRL